MAAAPPHPYTTQREVDHSPEQPEPVPEVPPAPAADALNRPEGLGGRGCGDQRLLPFDQP